jgi:hypothetical protein
MFPVEQGAFRDPNAAGKLCLGQACLGAYFRDVNFWNRNLVDDSIGPCPFEKVFASSRPCLILSSALIAYHST